MDLKRHCSEHSQVVLGAITPRACVLGLIGLLRAINLDALLDSHPPLHSHPSLGSDPPLHSSTARLSSTT